MSHQNPSLGHLGLGFFFVKLVSLGGAYDLFVLFARCVPVFLNL